MPKKKAEMKLEKLELKKLKQHSKNWKNHGLKQKYFLRSVINEVGWVNVVALVNRRTMNVLDGHLRLGEALRRGIKFGNCLTIDVPIEKEEKILALLDKVRDYGKIDKDKYKVLIEKMAFTDEVIAKEIDSFKKDIMKYKESEFKMSPEMLVSYNYVVLVFKEEINYEWAKEEFGIVPMIDQYTGKKGKFHTVDGDAYVEKS